MTEALSDIGEFGLIQRLVARLGVPADIALVGPGDDCAVVRIGGRGLLATTDMLVEGRHFDLRWSSPRDVGFKSLAVSVSDVAAMGGAPSFALVSVGAPASTEIETLEELYGGLSEAAAAYGVAIVGGDTVRCDLLTINVALMGEPTHDVVTLRSGAQVGDAICVTGDLGGAAAALHLFRANELGVLERFPSLSEAHRRGRARVKEGIAALHAGAHAMIDISDGLLQDLGHVCSASTVGAALRSPPIPVAPGVVEAERALGLDGIALHGGDDYELLITIAPLALETLGAQIAPTPVTQIGVVTETPGITLDGITVDPSSGWDHFR